MTIAEALRRGTALQEAGRLRDAERFYLAILKLQPTHPAANHNMGLLAVQAGRPDVGLPFFKTALATRPDAEKYWLSYLFAVQEAHGPAAAGQILAEARSTGLDAAVADRLSDRLAAMAAARAGAGLPPERQALADALTAGRYAAAEAMARATVAASPEDAFAWKVLGESLVRLERPEEAASCLAQALRRAPQDPEAAAALGNVLLAAGRLAEAVPLYRRALAAKPDFPEVHNNLGTALQRLGRLHEAVQHFLRALAVKPDFPEASNNLGNAYQAIGSLDEAVKYYRRALALRPDYVEAHSNLGNALQDLDRPGEAVEHYRQALAGRPDAPEVHNNLGNALQGLGRPGEAVASYRRALELAPDYAEAYSNLGTALKELGRTDEAVASYRRALECRPGDAGLHVNVGNALRVLGRSEEALDCYAAALELRPDDASTCNAMGNVLQSLGRLPEAEERYRRALSLDPDYLEAHNNLGVALAVQGRTSEAIACYMRLLELEPYHAEALNNLGNALKDSDRLLEAVAQYARALDVKPNVAEVHNNLGNVLQALGRSEEAISRYERALALRPDSAEAASNLLFAMGHCGRVSPETYLARAREWDRIALPDKDRQAAAATVFRRCAGEDRPLRIGYVSGDFRQHAVCAFLEALFAGHDRQRCEVFAYAASPRTDAVTARLRDGADHWVDLAGCDDAAAVERIRRDGIDVLVDLAGHTGGNRLPVFARRAAPVQAHYLGYFASTGLAAMDYLISDATVVPPGADGDFSEKVWRLPRVWVAYHPVFDAPEPAWKPDPAGRIWFGSFNKLSKLTAATVALWGAVLRECRQGHLLLKAAAFDSPAIREQWLRIFAEQGVEPARLHLTGREAGWAEHMALYDCLDIALDPVGGHCGVTTTCDALWMGVPVITLAGTGMIRRMGASILTGLGRPEWIAADADDYVAKAVRLAGQVAERQAMRVAQRDAMRRSPLGDTAGLARSLEDAYAAMFDAWLAGRPAD